MESNKKTKLDEMTILDYQFRMNEIDYILENFEVQANHKTFFIKTRNIKDLSRKRALIYDRLTKHYFPTRIMKEGYNKEPDNLDPNEEVAKLYGVPNDPKYDRLLESLIKKHPNITHPTHF